MQRKVYLLAPISIWILSIITSFIWNVHSVERGNRLAVMSIGRSFFSEIQTTRLWNAMHGGVYVKITEKTQPNEYLDVPHRDIESVNGLKLTMINPAFMTRQIAEIAEKNNDIQYHITSLKPIRPDNKADTWEVEALLSFEEGKNEVFTMNKEETQFRYMAPLFVKQPCLKCHLSQGYEAGDIRGGISVSIPAQQYLENMETTKNNLRIIHVVALFLGLAVFFHIKRSQTRELELQDERNKVLQRQATVDHLTGLYNRQYFNHRLAEEKARSDRYNTTLSMVIFDIDKFKQVNDTYGHLIGDDVLKQISRLVYSNIRPPDTLARWGGEEFALLVPENDLEATMSFAEKLRLLIESHAFPVDWWITCSFGVSEFRKGENAGDFINRSDQALYKAKESGRNRVCTD